MEQVSFGHMVSQGSKTYVPVAMEVPPKGSVSVFARTTGGHPVPAKLLAPWGREHYVLVVPALLATVKVSLVVRNEQGKTAAHTHFTVRPSLAFLSSTVAKNREDARELWYAGLDDAPCGSPATGSTYVELERLYTDHQAIDVLHGTIEFLGQDPKALARPFGAKLIDIYGRPLAAPELVVMRDSTKKLGRGAYLRSVSFSQKLSRQVHSCTLWVRHPHHCLPDGFLSFDAEALAWHRHLDEGRRASRPDGVGYHDWYVHNGQASGLELACERLACRERAAKEPALRVSLLIDLDEQDPVGLEETILSLSNQTYGAWELVGFGNVGPSGAHRWQGSAWSGEPALGAQPASTERPPARESLPPATAAQALALAQGELVGLVSVGDTLEPNALFELVNAFGKNPQAVMVFGDQDLRAPGDAGRSYYLQAVFKTAFDQDALYSLGATGRPALVQKSVLNSQELDAHDTPGLALDLALALGALEAAQARGVVALQEALCHVPQVLYHTHQREGYWTGRELVPPYGSAQAKACNALLAAHLARWQTRAGEPLPQKEAAEPTASVAAATAGPTAAVSVTVADNMASWVGRTVDYELKDHPLISIVIPNKDSVPVLARCLDAIAKKSTYDAYEIIVVENNSTDAATFAYYESLGATPPQEALAPGAPNAPGAGSARVRVVRYKGPFNFSAICNRGAREAKGAYLLFLNNDTEVVEPRWLELLAGPLSRANVGAVGARLLYADDLLQHGGVIIQAEGPLHAELFVPPTYDAYLGLSRFHTHQMSAVTGACLMTRRDVFEQVGGFDETLPIAYNDVEFCVQVRRLGLGVVMEPRATLYHYESYSRGLDYGDTQKEIRLVSEIGQTMLRWGRLYAQGDPFYDHRYAYHNNYYTLGWSPSLHAVED